MNQTTTPPLDSHALTAIIATYGVIFLIFFIVQIIVCWRVAAKAGYPGALSLLMLIPGVNFVIVLLFAFLEWPIERTLKTYERATVVTGVSGPPTTI